MWSNQVPWEVARAARTLHMPTAPHATPEGVTCEPDISELYVLHTLLLSSVLCGGWLGRAAS